MEKWWSGAWLWAKLFVQSVGRGLDIVTPVRGLLVVVVFVLFVIHGIAPQAFTLDATSFLLLTFLTILGLAPVLKSAKLPGGAEFQFRKQVAAAEALERRVEKRMQVEQSADRQGRRWPGLFDVPQGIRELASTRPGQALASLRFEIERGLRDAVRVLRGPLPRLDPPNIGDLVLELAGTNRVRPEQLALLTAVLDLTGSALMSGEVSVEDANRVLAIVDTLNESFGLGYSLDFRPNIEWKEQGLACQYEHCIENMPLPPVSRSEESEWRQHVQDFLSAGRYDHDPALKNHFIEILSKPIPDDAPEVVDRTGSCPIFGHYCPGGPETVADCPTAHAWLHDSADNDSADDNLDE